MRRTAAIVCVLMLSLLPVSLTYPQAAHADKDDPDSRTTTPVSCVHDPFF